MCYSLRWLLARIGAGNLPVARLCRQLACGSVWCQSALAARRPVGWKQCMSEVECWRRLASMHVGRRWMCGCMVFMFRCIQGGWEGGVCAAHLLAPCTVGLGLASLAVGCGVDRVCITPIWDLSAHNVCCIGGCLRLPMKCMLCTQPVRGVGALCVWRNCRCQSACQPGRRR